MIPVMEPPEQMNWHTVRVLVACTVDEEPAVTLEDRLILVQAASREEARVRGASLAEATDHEYANADGETVRWRFQRVIDTHPILDQVLGDGVEVYSAFVSNEMAAIL